MKSGKYQDDQKKWHPCQIVRLSRKHARIQLPDGTPLLHPSNRVRYDSGMVSAEKTEGMTTMQQIVPEVPLQRLYKTMRSLKGSKQDRFDATVELLNPKGVRDASEFLVELFQRSIRQMQFYCNENEGFYPETRLPRIRKDRKFADALIQTMGNHESYDLPSGKMRLVDYEIYPLRTTGAIRENGKSARSKASGTMDALLAVTQEGVTLPGIGEIKADTEQVGVTFALIQSLMNASLLVTPSQFRRLKLRSDKEYDNCFGELDCQSPKVDIVIMIDDRSTLIQEDFELAKKLGDSLQKILSEHIRGIHIFKTTKDARFELFE